MKNLIHAFMLFIALLQTVPAAASGASQISVENQRASLELQAKTFAAVQAPSEEKRSQLLSEILDSTAQMNASQRLAVINTLMTTLEAGRAYGQEGLLQKRTMLIAADVILVLISMRGYIPSQKPSILRVLSGIAGSVAVLVTTGEILRTPQAQAALDLHAQLLLNELKDLRTAAESAAVSEAL